jgi:hypothetical protein
VSLLKRRRIVYILGAGPAGLLAAEAAHLRGCEVLVFTRPSESGNPLKSELHGCQYLHAPLPSPDLAGDGHPVQYRLQGDVEGYRRKVYGARWRGEVSPDEYGSEEPHMAWDLRSVYDQLWDKWYWRLVPKHINAGTLDSLLTHGRPYRMLSTIPAPALCVYPEHQFVSEDVWAIGETPTQKPPVTCDPFTVLCNGEPDTGWYRVANVYGHTTVEWPGGRRKPPLEGVVRVQKPLTTDCDCWMYQSGYRRLGRFGQWQKGVLVHQVFNDAMETLK